MNLSSIVQQDVMEELRKGNTAVLKGLPPVLAMQYGSAMQKEAGDYIDPSPIDTKEVGKAMLNLMADTGIKEQLLKQMDQEVTGE